MIYRPSDILQNLVKAKYGSTRGPWRLLGERVSIPLTFEKGLWSQRRSSDIVYPLKSAKEMKSLSGMTSGVRIFPSSFYTHTFTTKQDALVEDCWGRNRWRLGTNREWSEPQQG